MNETYNEQDEEETQELDEESKIQVKRAEYIKQILENMTEEQLTRFEFFIRSHLTKSRVRNIMDKALEGKYNITDEMVIIVSGLSKLFIGEIVDSAVDAAKEDSVNQVYRKHILEACRRLDREGKMNIRNARFGLFESGNTFSNTGDPFVAEGTEET